MFSSSVTGQTAGMWGDSDEDGDPFADDSCKDSDDMSSCTYDDHHRKAPTMLGVEAMWKEGALVDYTIEIDDQQFHVHKVIIASMCDYFRVMFSSGMKESQANKINLTKSVSAAAMETLLEYIYTNRIYIDEDNARELLKAAMYLQIEEVIKKCTKFISDDLDANSCLEDFAIFTSCNIQSGIKATEKYILSSFERVLNKHPATKITHEELLVLIDLWQQSEKQLFDLIVSWINCEPDERKKYWDELLTRIRFCVMPSSDLEKISELVKDGKEVISGQWCDLIDKAKEYHTLPTHRKVLYDSTQTQVRKQPSLCAFSRGLQESPGFYNELEDFGKWKSDAALEIPGVCRQAYATVTVNNFLITCVDSDGAQRWFIFDPRTSEWSDMPGMPTERVGFALVHHGEYLYALGGALLQGDRAVTDIIERYDISNNRWSPFKKLPVAVRDHGACFLGDVLYVSGGTSPSPGTKEVDDPTDERYPGLARVDCFDLSNSKQTWESKAPMLKSHGKHLMHIMKIGDEDLIYVIDKAAKVERYSPKTNTWRKYTYSVTHKLPRLFPEYMMVAEGHKVLLIDVNVHACYHNEPNGAVLIRFPKVGWVTQATNVFRPHFPFDRKSKKHMQARDEEYPFPVCALLCFPPRA